MEHITMLRWQSGFTSGDSSARRFNNDVSLPFRRICPHHKIRRQTFSRPSPPSNLSYSGAAPELIESRLLKRFRRPVEGGEMPVSMTACGTYPTLLIRNSPLFPG